MNPINAGRFVSDLTMETGAYLKSAFIRGPAFIIEKIRYNNNFWTIVFVLFTLYRTKPYQAIFSSLWRILGPVKVKEEISNKLYIS